MSAGGCHALSVALLSRSRSRPARRPHAKTTASTRRHSTTGTTKRGIAPGSPPGGTRAARCMRTRARRRATPAAANIAQTARRCHRLYQRDPRASRPATAPKSTSTTSPSSGTSTRRGRGSTRSPPPPFLESPAATASRTSSTRSSGPSPCWYSGASPLPSAAAPWPIRTKRTSSWSRRGPRPRASRPGTARAPPTRTAP
mmetsp:Transcript_15437/g.46139  ORF Transcript_15437/g.46139 Transcript_15437/m.46139 type:complete len:200 (-) Transcript_15437:329-928(-)